jgi:hypothetical protein
MLRMNANEVAVHEMQRDRDGVSVYFFEKPLVTRVKPHRCIHIVRF